MKNGRSRTVFIVVTWKPCILGLVVDFVSFWVERTYSSLNTIGHWYDAALWLADRMSTAQSESWQKRTWRTPSPSITLSPWEPRITARGPTSSTWGRPTGGSSCSRPRKDPPTPPDTSWLLLTPTHTYSLLTIWHHSVSLFWPVDTFSLIKTSLEVKIHKS